ncbi:DUF1269 domain-containing protein [Terrabacter sp. 2RAF25]|uniref:DUF1269 domain-containing protein n=1 Tax=Terrabacter sp. 2RAF25 TaxID=3232998 RepID=UPI003F9AB2AC
MSTLTVWKFGTSEGAAQAERTLGDLQKQQLITVLDAAVVSWPEGRKKPTTRQLHNLAGSGALGGSFWGFLFGLIFLVPLLGMVVGAAMGALAGSLADVGISDEFIKDVRTKVTPGSSALFVLTANAVQDRVAEAFAGTNAELLATNLSGDQEEAIRQAFTDAEE